VTSGIPEPIAQRLIYQSSSGDTWYLARNGAGSVFVRHVPNQPSGGRLSEISVASFLTQSGGGPEHQELMRLIGTLVD
jgi:hypothetical protein